MFTVEQLNSVQHVASRATRHVTLKQNPLRREHLQGFVGCYLPGKDRSERVETGRGHGSDGQGAQDRSGGRRCRQVPRQRDLRPGQEGGRQDFQPDHRSSVRSARGRRGLSRPTAGLVNHHRNRHH
ncbi:hypothetical protein BSA16_25510 [Micromonospora sp. Rc5]|nr:hypothetical protein BSA16_25510 [Micromonospora sp. Rc5]